MEDKGRRQNQNFMKRGGALAVFTMIIWILCIIKLIPIAGIIGDKGIAVYAIAFESFLVIYLLSTFSLPLFVSRMIAVRLSRSQYKNVKRVFRVCLLTTMMIGAVLAVLFFFLSDIFAEQFFRVPYASLTMKCIGVSFILYAAVGVLKGYFQGFGTMMPSCVASVLEQFVTLTVSLFMTHSFYNYGKKIAAFLNEENYAPAYGAVAVGISVCIGAFVSLVFLVFLYWIYQRNFKKNLSKDTSKTKEEKKAMIGQLYGTMLPASFVNVLIFANTLINQKLYFMLQGQGTLNTTLNEYGVFYGKYKVLTFIPIIMLLGLCQSVTPFIGRLKVREAYHQMRNEFSNGLKQTVIVGAFFSFVFTVLSGVLSGILFKQNAQLNTKLLLIGSFAILFYGAAFYTSAFLKGLSMPYVQIALLIAALVLQGAVLYVLLSFTKLGVVSLVIANMVFPFLTTIFNVIVIKKNIS